MVIVREDMIISKLVSAEDKVILAQVSYYYRKLLLGVAVNNQG